VCVVVFSCGRSDDCEELVGVTHRRWWGWFRRNPTYIIDWWIFWQSLL